MNRIDLTLANYGEQRQWVSIKSQSIVSLNKLSMCLYRVSLVGRKKRRSFQLRMRGMSLMPSKWARPNTGVDWAWVLQFPLVGYPPDVFLSGRPRRDRYG